MFAASVCLCGLAACGSSAPAGAGGNGEAADVVLPALALPLSHRGRWITDAQGRVVVFHGTNVAAKLRPYTPQSQGFTREHAAMLAREGFDTVRVWVFWNAIEPSPGVWDDSSLAELKQFVGWLNAYGISTTLNFAQVIWSEKFGGLGFPDWAADTGGLQPAYFGGDVADGLLEPALHSAFDRFWANETYPGDASLQDQFAAAWQHVAAYFRDVPGIIAYDVMNEPEGGSQQLTCLTPVMGCPLFDTLDLTPFYQRVVTAIRQVDATHLIEYEPEVLNATGLMQSHVAAGNDPGLIYTFHYYPQTGDAGLNVAAPLALSFNVNTALANGDGLLLSEFGAKDDLTYLQGIIDACDRALIGWQYWAWYSTEPTGNPGTPTTEVDNPQEGIVIDPTQPPAESNLKTDKLALLGRPYPYFVAGTPTAWHFDIPSRSFTLSYSTTPVDGGAPLAAPTVIIVPPRLYPGGSYQVAVKGAEVTSDAGAVALSLQADPGASNVLLTVTPR